MTKEIIVPPLGESVTEATIAKWLKAEGEAVALDEAIVELETDKVTLEVNAPAAGVLKSIAVKEGESIAVGALLGTIEEGAAPSAPAPESEKPETPVAPQEEKKEEEKKEEAPKKTENSSVAGTPSPAAGKMMQDNNIVDESIAGTGKDGRVTKEDVIVHLSGNSTEQASSSNTAAAPKAASGQEERVKMTRLRQRIAERLKEAQNTAAILTTFNEIDMSNVMKLRGDYKDKFEKKHGVKLGFMSFFTKAAITALKDFPAVNAEIAGDEIIYKNHYDISIAVSTPAGLVVPVVRNADHLTFAEVEKEIGNLADKARDGKLSMEDMTGGTFTITNGGVFGSLVSTPILNTPQTGILGLHKIEKRPVVVGDEIVVRPMMYVALSYDHRIIDGRESVGFLVRIKECIEDPQRLLLDM